MTGILLIGGFAALAGIAYTVYLHGASFRFTSAPEIGQNRLADADRGARIFGEIGNILKRHRASLSTSFAAFKKNITESPSDLARANAQTSFALGEQLELLEQINENYSDVYRNEEENIRSYQAMTLDLERLLGSESGNPTRDQTGATSSLVKRILWENEKLRTRIATCERQIVTLLSDVTRLEREARTDSLTRLPNRRAWDEDLAARTNEFDSVFVMVDLDRFKAINDTYGHSIGDGVLTLVSTLMRNTPEVDCYRIAGDEFAMVLSARRWHRVGTMLEDFRQRVEKAALNHEGKRIQVTVSMGAARRLSDESNSKTLRRADEAVYAAKSQGGNAIYLHHGTAVLKPGDDAPSSELDGVSSTDQHATSQEHPPLTATPS